MTQSEIKRKIDENNFKIESLFTGDIFTLNNEIQNLLKENNELQKQCKHEFNDYGLCIYCYMQKTEEF